MEKKIFKNAIKAQLKDLVSCNKFTCDLATDETVILLQGLYDRSQDFIKFITGKYSRDTEAQLLLSEIPDVSDISYGNKADIVIFDLEGRVVGVIDLLMGYPERTTLSIGLLLIDPAYRGTGLGSELFEQCLSLTKKEFALRKVSLIVQEANAAALRFWQRKNFSLISSRNCNKTGQTEFIMELALTL